MKNGIALLLSLHFLFNIAIADNSDSIGKMKVIRNIPYVVDGHPNQVLNIYLPGNPPAEAMPLMVWIHGGAWMVGDHAHPQLLYLIDEGFAVASVQYRFSSHAIWPAQGLDCKAAISFLSRNADKYNIDPDKFAVGGDSAGGHLAAYIGTTGNNSEQSSSEDNFKSDVKAVIDFYGPTNLAIMGKQSGPESIMAHDAPDSPESLLMGGPIQEKLALAKTANPITYIDQNDPPFLIIHGNKDNLVPLGQSVILAEALMRAGISEVTLRTIDGAGHGGADFHSPETRQIIVDFLKRHLQ